MAAAWRLLRTGPGDGPANMAVDETLLRARIAGTGPPTVRLYGWSVPTVSLGYGQPLEGGIDWAACARLGIARVRRPTGGQALLHEPPGREVTYAVAAGAGDFPGADDLLETYRVIGAGLVAGLARLGVAAEVVPLARARRGPDAPAFCFGRTGAYEVAVGGRKLVGSAQRRQAGAFLQHGALLLDADPARLRAVFGDAEGLDVATLAGALGRPPGGAPGAAPGPPRRRVPGFEEVAGALAAGLAEALGAALRPGPLSPEEAAAARALARDRYASPAWLAGGAGAAVPAGRAPAAAARAEA